MLSWDWTVFITAVRVEHKAPLGLANTQRRYMLLRGSTLVLHVWVVWYTLRNLQSPYHDKHRAWVLVALPCMYLLDKPVWALNRVFWHETKLLSPQYIPYQSIRNICNVLYEYCKNTVCQISIVQNGWWPPTGFSGEGSAPVGFWAGCCGERLVFTRDNNM